MRSYIETGQENSNILQLNGDSGRHDTSYVCMKTDLQKCYDMRTNRKQEKGRRHGEVVQGIIVQLYCPLYSRNNRGDRGDWSPNFQVGDQQCIVPPTFWPQFSKSKKFRNKYCYFSVTLSHSTFTPHSADILVDIQPATVERLSLRSSVVYISVYYGPR